MKSTIATVVILMSILALMAGGFVMSRRMSVGDHANCLVTTSGSSECIRGMDPFQSAITHVSALLNVSLGVMSSLVLTLFASFVLLSWRVQLAILDISSISPTVSRYSKIFTEGAAGSIYKQRRWISMHEKRDPSLFCAMNT